MFREVCSHVGGVLNSVMIECYTQVAHPCSRMCSNHKLYIRMTIEDGPCLLANLRVLNLELLEQRLILSGAWIVLGLTNWQDMICGVKLIQHFSLHNFICETSLTH